MKKVKTFLKWIKCFTMGHEPEERIYYDGQRWLSSCRKCGKVIVQNNRSWWK